MISEDIKRRIGHMRSLINHPNTSEVEREVAIGRLSHLMDLYHLSEADIAPEKIELITHAIPVDTTVLWPRGLAKLIDDMYSTVSLISSNTSDPRRTLQIIFSGYKEDVEQSVAAWNVLYPQILHLATKLRRQRQAATSPQYITTIQIGGWFAATNFSFNLINNRPLDDAGEDSWGYGILLALGERLKAARNTEQATTDTVTNNAVVVIHDARQSTVRDRVFKELGVNHAAAGQMRILDQGLAQQGIIDSQQIKFTEAKELPTNKMDETHGKNI